MSVWTAVVAMVAILAFASMRIARYNAGAIGRRGDRHGQPHDALPSAREVELAREVEDLRDRMAVLERIATDDRRSREIADEIERLRDR